MAVSVFDLFKIGIGPSSSHTVGPMRAARLFVQRLAHDGLLDRTARVHVALYGSLGATGKGHGTDKAVMLGLEGLMPDTIDPDTIEPRLKAMRASGQIQLGGTHPLAFSEKNDLTFLRREALPYHSNGVKFVAFDAEGNTLTERRYFSVGGGFVVSQEEADSPMDGPAIVSDPTKVRYPFSTGADLTDGPQPVDRTREGELGSAEAGDEVAAAHVATLLQSLQHGVDRGEAALDPLGQNGLAGEHAVTLEQLQQIGRAHV